MVSMCAIPIFVELEYALRVGRGARARPGSGKEAIDAGNRQRNPVCGVNLVIWVSGYWIREDSNKDSESEVIQGQPSAR